MELIEQAKGYKKMNYHEMMTTDFNCQKFLRDLNVHDGRVKLRINTFMITNVKLNYPSDPTYTKERWMCCDCTEPIVGPTRPRSVARPMYWYVNDGHADLRVDADLGDDRQLVQYFCEVIKRREELAQERKYV